MARHAAHGMLVISPSSKHAASLRRLERNSPLEVLGSDTQNLLIIRRKELADFIPSDRNLQFSALRQCAKSLFPTDGKRSWIAIAPGATECSGKGGKRVKIIKDVRGTVWLIAIST